MHPLDTGDRLELVKDELGLGYCNITKCCTEVCPEHIKITDNAIIPLKERVVDRFYDPVKKLLRIIFPKSNRPSQCRSHRFARRQRYQRTAAEGQIAVRVEGLSDTLPIRPIICSVRTLRFRLLSASTRFTKRPPGTILMPIRRKGIIANSKCSVHGPSVMKSLHG